MMTTEEKIARANAMKHLAESEGGLFELFDALERKYFDEWRSADLDDIAAREAAWNRNQALRDLRTVQTVQSLRCLVSIWLHHSIDKLINTDFSIVTAILLICCFHQRKSSEIKTRISVGIRKDREIEIEKSRIVIHLVFKNSD